MHKLARAAAMAALAAATAPGYYHFLHYPSRSGPFLPIPEKFDLGALPNKTVPLLVSELGPTQMAPGDSFASVVNQVRLAAKVWNDVETSDLRVGFAGLFTPGTPQSAPHVEVIFDDVPGVLAKCGPIRQLDPVASPGGPFVPIARSVCTLNRDLATPSPRPSFGEAFFLTTVHELGHALGLQHSATSGVMSTEITRATSRAVPLASDDIAGISALYPTARFAAQSGSISGYVSMAGQSVHLASVVALMADRSAYSALTHPDGSYRIEGLPPGQYYVYVHPLPPTQLSDLGPGEIVLPIADSDRRPIAASDPFDLQFYPGVRDPQQAFLVPVAVGASTTGVNFAVQRRASVQLYGVTTYSFPGPVAVKPAYLSAAGTQSLVAIASGVALTSGGAPRAGLSISVLGAGLPAPQMRAYPQSQQYLQMDFLVGQVAPGPRHLVFSLNNEVYVLPSAFHVVATPPPSISTVTAAVDPTGSRVVVVTGANLQADTRIAFDGLPAVRKDSAPGVVVVTPPPGASNHLATVTALNSDGQSSLFLQANAPATYLYEPAEPAAITLSPASLPAGAEAMVEITGLNTNFVDGYVQAGFGSGDIAVRRVWVVSPTRVRAQVYVWPAASPGNSLVSVVNGFQVVTQPMAFQVQPANPRLVVIQPQLVNPGTGLAPYPGSPAVISVANLPLGAGMTLFINDTPVSITSVGPGQISFLVPPGLPAGPAVLRLMSGSELIYPVIVSIEAPPLMILAVTNAAGVVDAARPARGGDFLILTMANLADPGAVVAPARVKVSVAGAEQQVLSVTPLGNMHQILFILSPAVAAGQQALTVSVEGRTSLPGVLFVRGQ